MSVERRLKIVLGAVALLAAGATGQHFDVLKVLARPQAPIAVSKGGLNAPAGDGGVPPQPPTETPPPTATVRVVPTATSTAVPTARPTEKPTSKVEIKSAISCEGTVIALPSRHGEIQPGSLNSSAPIGRWFNPIYNAAEANAEHNWRGIGPWAPIAFKNVDANAAELKTFGNLGHFVIRGLSGGRVAIAFWQQEQHQNDTKMRPDGTLNPAWKNQYTFTGLEPNAPVGLFDPDTGKDLNTWSDGSPINYTANELGTFSIELPAGEARVGVCAPIPGQKAGIQAPEIQVFRGPNDHPELKGENPLPDAVKKPTMPD